MNVVLDIPENYEQPWDKFFDYVNIPRLTDIEYTAKSDIKKVNRAYLNRNKFKFTFFEMMSTITYREI